MLATILSNLGSFREVRKYKGVSVLVPTTERTRRLVFDGLDVYAFALNNKIFVEKLKYAKDEALMEHEYTHVQQERELGVMFAPLYYIFHWTLGYEDNPFEIDAEKAEAKIRERVGG